MMLVETKQIIRFVYVIIIITVLIIILIMLLLLLLLFYMKHESQFNPNSQGSCATFTVTYLPMYLHYLAHCANIVWIPLRRPFPSFLVCVKSTWNGKRLTKIKYIPRNAYTHGGEETLNWVFIFPHLTWPTCQLGGFGALGVWWKFFHEACKPSLGAGLIHYTRSLQEVGHICHCRQLCNVRRK